MRIAAGSSMLGVVGSHVGMAGWVRNVGLASAICTGVLGVPVAAAQETLSSPQDLEKMPAEEVRAALPSIMRAAAAGEEALRAQGAFAAFAVSIRPDGRTLLAPYAEPLARLLGAGTERVRYLAYVALTTAASRERRDWVQPVVDTLRDRTRSGAQRLHALAAALNLTGDDSSAADAAEAYFYEPLDVDTQAAALQLLAQSPVKSARFRAIAVLALESSYPRVKLAAIDVIARMGGEALAEARDRLRAIVERGTEEPDVRQAAAGALKGK